MDQQEGVAKFKSADALFGQGDFQGALALLNELDLAYPNTRNILYPKALCLLRLGMPGEAESVATALVQQFEDPRGQALLAEIQAAKGPAADDLMAGLDMSALDGLFEPKPKRAAPAAPPPSNSMRKVLIGVAAVVAVAVIGAGAYFGIKLLPKGETVESVEAKLLDIWSKAESYSATLAAKADVKQGGMPMPMSIQVSGTLEFSKKDGKSQFRLDAVNAISGGPMSMNMPMLAVSDGADVYFQIDMMGKPMVMKSKPPADSQFTPDVAKLAFGELEKSFNVRLLPEELLDGLRAYVFEMTPKPGAPTAAPIPGMDKSLGKIKLYFTKDVMTQVKVDVQDNAGGPIVTASLKDIKMNAPIAADRFKYTPPDGVKVMDASDAAGMMKMFGGK